MPSIANHRLPINRIAAPPQEKTSLRAPLQLEDKYLSDLEAIDPYDFPVRSMHFVIFPTYSQSFFLP